MFSHLSRRSSTPKARRRRVTRQFRLEGLEERTLLALNAIDINATITSTPVAMNGALFFTATDAAHGNELWTSDGTAAGTGLLKDIHPGPLSSAAANLTVVGN